MLDDTVTSLECFFSLTGCFDNGKQHENGEEWQQDKCETCYCEAGQVYCQAEMCAGVCSNPRPVEGQCCPVCDEGMHL